MRANIFDSFVQADGFLRSNGAVREGGTLTLGNTGIPAIMYLSRSRQVGYVSFICRKIDVVVEMRQDEDFESIEAIVSYAEEAIRQAHYIPPNVKTRTFHSLDELSRVVRKYGFTRDVITGRYTHETGEVYLVLSGTLPPLGLGEDMFYTLVTVGPSPQPSVEHAQEQPRNPEPAPYVKPERRRALQIT